MNRARKFITMKMKKRMELRATKKGKKDHLKARKLLSERVIEQLRAQFAQQGLIKADGQVEEGAEGTTKKFTIEIGGSGSVNVSEKQAPVNDLKKADTGNVGSADFSAVKPQRNEADTGSMASDEILNISSTKQKKKKKSKSQRKRDAAIREEASGEKKRRVVFKVENNITREFHKHSKVATRVLPSSSKPTTILKSAIKKPREAKQAEKLNAKVAKFAQ